jgi:hypothetical protein
MEETKSQSLAFQLDLLEKLDLTKSGIGDSNLLEFIILHAERYCPTMLDLPAQLQTVPAAVRVSLDDITAEVKNVQDMYTIINMEKLYLLLKTSHNTPRQILPNSKQILRVLRVLQRQLVPSLRSMTRLNYLKLSLISCQSGTTKWGKFKPKNLHQKNNISNMLKKWVLVYQL